MEMTAMPADTPDDDTTRPAQITPESVTKHTDAEIVNGDPYVAVVMKRTDSDLTPDETATILLGTGFESFDNITQTLTRLLNDADERDIADVDFQADEAHVFELAGEIEFAESD